MLKIAHMIIDAVTRLCGMYAEAVTWKFPDEKLETENNSMACEEINNFIFVIFLVFD